MAFIKPPQPVGKKLVNSPENCVEDMLHGIASAYPGLSICTSSRIIMRLEPHKDSKCVGIISGGGSGHEPFSAGFVGRGMLNAAVAGSVFSSPPVSHCLTAIQNVAEHSQGGVLVLILNYTGDIINFGQAIEIAKDEGINVEGIVIGDDCALIGAEERIIGRRGLAGMLFVFKIAGALAISGQSLSVIIENCQQVSENMATLGVCVKPCTVPGSETPLFSLGDHQMELGVGIHGEAGVLKINACYAAEIVDVIIRKIIHTLSLKHGEEVCAIVNNLGGSSQMESYIISSEISKQLEKRGILVARIYVGNLMTSLDMGGIQISLLRTSGHEEWVKFLDADTDAVAWPGSLFSHEKTKINVEVKNIQLKKTLIGPEISPEHSLSLRNCLITIAAALRMAEQKLNSLDSGCGDGDCGTTLKQFAEAVLKAVDYLPLSRPQSCFLELAEIASEKMGGTTGGLYCLMLRGAARYVPEWVMAWNSAMEVAKKYTPARLGYRTMMDSLIPAFEEFESQMESTQNWLIALDGAVAKADSGCESTRNMRALLGRASYVDEKYWKDVDAGAYAVTVWLKAIHSALTEQNNLISID